MTKKQRTRFFIIFGLILAVIIILLIITGHENAHEESIQTVMKDAVLHESYKIDLFGMEVNPGLISAFAVTGIFLVFGLIVRFIAVPRFKKIPGKFQMFLEMIVGIFDNMAKTNSPHFNYFLGAYIFTAGCYIAVGTVFELFGLQASTIQGTSISLPAPLADINGAVCMGCLTYLIIMSGGLIKNGFKGVLLTLKDFSLPISMSFRLFGALLSGALVTELVYHYPLTRIGFPMIVGVLFTLLHALIQAYVLTTLCSVFYGEVTEKKEKQPKPPREPKRPKRAKEKAAA